MTVFASYERSFNIKMNKVPEYKLQANNNVNNKLRKTSKNQAKVIL